MASAPNMSPMLISSFRRERSSPAPALRDSTDHDDSHDLHDDEHDSPVDAHESQTSILWLSGLTTYQGRVVTESHPWGVPDSPMFSLDDMDYSEGSTLPPSTQPRPLNWGIPRSSPSLPDENRNTDGPEWSMEQYICFVYRGRSVGNITYPHMGRD